MNWQTGARTDRTALIDGLPDNVQDAAERFRAHRHLDRAACVLGFLATHHPFGGIHCYAANGVLAQMLRHFQHQFVAIIVRRQGVQDRWQITIEMDVDNCAQNLRYLAN